MMKLKNKLKRVLIKIEYDGFNFSGWQKQKHSTSIQQNLEDAAKKLTNRITFVQGSGRTDAGVHALAQVAHLDVPENLNEYSIVNGLNKWLSTNEISVLSAETVDKNFHARFDAIQRTYVYKILNSKTPSALDRNRVWHYRYPLDYKKMENASKILLGQHDFSSFRSSICQSKSPIKTIDEISIKKINKEIIITVKARSFLHHQVRNFVGSLCFIGNGKWGKNDLINILDARDRNKAGPTAPAHGLYLAKIEY